MWFWVVSPMPLEDMSCWICRATTCLLGAKPNLKTIKITWILSADCQHCLHLHRGCKGHISPAMECFLLNMCLWAWRCDILHRNSTKMKKAFCKPKVGLCSWPVLKQRVLRYYYSASPASQHHQHHAHSAPWCPAPPHPLNLTILILSPHWSC